MDTLPMVRHGRRLRIALVAPPWLPVPPPAYGGTEAVIDTLARGLQAQGHEVLLVAHAASTCPVPRASVLPADAAVPMGMTVHEVRHVLGAYRLIERFGPDVVHDHTVVGPLYGVAHLQGARLVVTNHGCFDDDTTPPYRDVADRSALVCISAAQAASAAAQGVQAAAVIHHGIDTRAWPVGDGSGGYAVFLGRLNPAKGVAEAITIARAAGVPLRIAARVREPLEHEYFDTAIRPQLGRDVEYVGEVGGTAKQELLGAAIALVNPIAWPEPFGMVMIEAMAAGTPVLTRPFGAAPEVVRDGVTGWVSADPAVLVARLRAVASAGPDPVLRAACRERVARCFSMERMAGDHARLYRSLLASSSVSISSRTPCGTPNTTG